MNSLLHLLCILSLFNQDSYSQNVITQLPAFISVAPGGSATISCLTTCDVGSYMAWYRKKPGEKPKLLIYSSSSRFSDAPSHISGTGSQTSFNLTISAVKSEDEGHYYCQQYKEVPLT
uniref:Ig-like domain-containing protein n=1 Tax=Erpetoichthys calabaricus TaxID=27687 RepID=A0A8C4RFE5_ERPCA